MARNRTGNYPISGKACDVEYRAKRLEVLTEKARLALASIDPSAVAEGAIARGIELVTELAEIATRIAASKPAKRTYGKDKVAAAEKPKKEPKAPKAPKEKPKKEKAPKSKVAAVEAVDSPDLELATLDAALEAAAE